MTSDPIVPTSSASPIHVVGIGLDGRAGLRATSQSQIDTATLLVGSDRHLSYFPHHPAPKLPLGNLQDAFQHIRIHLEGREPSLSSKAQPPTPTPSSKVVVLASGDPLFFGLGRLLLTEFSSQKITFHPHLSSVQLAFSRIKVPWHDAQIISVHGRSPDTLYEAIQHDAEKLAILTDNVHTPHAIAQLIQEIDRPQGYQLWVCENLGGADEKITAYQISELADPSHEPAISPLNIVIALRGKALAATSPPIPMGQHPEPDGQPTDAGEPPIDPATLPILGIADSQFASFSDRPGLMTKREIRVLALGELALMPNQVVWDIGAGTGSVAIEAARLCTAGQVFAVEKTAAGIHLIGSNMQRFQVSNVVPIAGEAPSALVSLPTPHRIFIGGSGSHLQSLLTTCCNRIQPDGILVVAIATLEHLAIALDWLKQPQTATRVYRHRVLTCQISRSASVGSLTRLAPLNPVNLLRIHFH